MGKVLINKIKMKTNLQIFLICNFLLAKCRKFSNILKFNYYEGVVKQETSKYSYLAKYANSLKINLYRTNATSHSYHKKVTLT